MRKFFAVMLAVLTGIAAAACSSAPAPSNDEAAGARSSEPAAETSEAAEESAEDSMIPTESSELASASETASNDASPEPDAEGTNVLVVYYSATGNTERVAGYIADTVHADTFAVTPTEAYSDADLDWTDGDSRVSREHDDESLRTVELESTTVEGWDNYDTVFIGYPIWWGIAAWPIDGFVSANDFTGKTVIPFCTSSSSGIGQSGELLAQLAETGDWTEGERFGSSVGEDDVASWVESLGLTA